MTRPGPHLSACPRPGMSGPWVSLVGSTWGATPHQARAEPRLPSLFPGTRPAPSSCHLTLGRPPKSRSSWAAGGAGWGPPAAAPQLKREGRLRTTPAASETRTRGLGASPPATPPAATPALPGPRGPQPPCPTRPAEPRENGAPETQSPTPKPPRRGAHHSQP